MLAKRSKVKRCQQKTELFRQHRILDFHQKKMYAEFNGDGVRPSEVPNAEDIWGDIWNVGKEHN